MFLPTRGSRGQTQTIVGTHGGGSALRSWSRIDGHTGAVDMSLHLGEVYGLFEDCASYGDIGVEEVSLLIRNEDFAGTQTRRHTRPSSGSMVEAAPCGTGRGSTGTRSRRTCSCASARATGS